jgi:drug/metabolite transporter (DMT)-like permease
MSWIGRGSGAALATAAGAAVLGFSPIFVRISELGPQATNFWRFALALPALAALALADGRRPNPKQAGALAVAGFLFGLELSLWAAALSFTLVANATLFSNMTPLVAAGAGFVLFREKLSAPTAAGIAAGLAGALMLALSRAEAASGPAHDVGAGWIGDGLGCASALGYAGYLIIVRALGRAVSVGAVMFIATAVAGLYAFVLAAALGESFWPHSLQGWLILAGLGLGVQLIGQGFIAYGVGRLPIAVSTVLLWMQPVTAALLSWLLFGEALAPLGLAGAALILGGVYIVQRARAR